MNIENKKEQSHRNLRLIFHALHYLSYPSYVIVGFYLIIKMDFSENLLSIENLNSLNVMLVFLGLGFSFSSLQDMSRYNTSHLSKKQIKRMSILSSLLVYLFILLALFFLYLGIDILYINSAFFLSNESLEPQYWKELGLGLLFLGIGILGMSQHTINVAEF